MRFVALYSSDRIAIDDRKLEDAISQFRRQAEQFDRLLGMSVQIIVWNIMQCLL
jgi:hypothetical protein